MSEQSKVHVESTIPLVQFYKMARKSNLKKTQYDPHQSPPDFESAKKHGIANRVCQYDPQLTNSSTSSVEKNDVCNCCNLPINNQLIPINAELRDLSHLGVTFPLYFQFIKKCACLLIAQFLLSSFYNLYLNLEGFGCSIDSFVCHTSIVNSYGYGLNFQAFEGIMNIMTIIVLIVIIEFFRVHQEISRYEIEKHRITPADFTIQISGFKADIGSVEILEFLNQFYQTQELDLCGVYLLMDMELYSEKYKQKLHLIDKINKLKAKERKRYAIDQNSLNQYQKLLNSLEDMLQHCESQFTKYAYLIDQQNQNHKLSMISETAESALSEPSEINVKFSGRVLVTFNKAEDCKRIVKWFKLSQMEHFYYWCFRRNIFRTFMMGKLQKYQYSNSIIRIKRAAEPSDINWMNVGSSKIHTKIWISLTIIGIFLLTCLALSGFKLVVKNKQYMLEQTQIITLTISLLVSTIVALTNTLIGIVIRSFAGKETHKKQTNYFVSVGKRLSYLFFINMVVTTFVANQFYQLPQATYVPHFRLIAMLNDFFFLFITNTYLSSIFNYFDIMWGVRLIKRYYQEKQGINSSLSQREANILFEGHPVDMALRYANVLKVMFFTAAISPLLPIGLPLSIIGLFVLYKMDKYLLLRRYVCKNYLDKQLAREMANILPLFVVFFSLGNLTIEILSTDPEKLSDIKFTTSFYIAMMGVIISIVYKYVFTIADFKRIYHYIFNIRIPEKKIDNTYQYYKQQEFSTSYEQYHPVLKSYQQGQGESDQQQPALFKNIKTSLQQQE